MMAFGSYKLHNKLGTIVEHVLVRAWDVFENHMQG